MLEQPPDPARRRSLGEPRTSYTPTTADWYRFTRPMLTGINNPSSPGTTFPQKVLFYLTSCHCGIQNFLAWREIERFTDGRYSGDDR